MGFGILKFSDCVCTVCGGGGEVVLCEMSRCEGGFLHKIRQPRNTLIEVSKRTCNRSYVEICHTKNDLALHFR